jgi:hypothetical protein
MGAVALLLGAKPLFRDEREMKRGEDLQEEKKKESVEFLRIYCS